ncbi:vWA domain-containing protein [Fischerella sp. PCC 9605]|uniref:vWA domain-containing protein n=1 Tax=Fischerella sp. PCC 9605 TaxID=1173024 RepID=UPI00047EE35D|nr:vWA domain-containing protein [Fischerella sp. PCC 9605]
MSRFRRSLWLYPLFQIPLIFFVICLVAAALCGFLRLGKPDVAVAIALDLSQSTYQGQPFNAPNTFMAQEVAAVQAYLELNSQQLSSPNQIQIFGSADQVVPLTNSFSSDKQKLESQLNQALANPILPLQVGEGTNVDKAIEESTKVLSSIQNHCRELLIVTDGIAEVSETVISQAVSKDVKINSLVVGADASTLKLAASITQGIYVSGLYNIQELFTNIFFDSFNSNQRWVNFWRGCAWIAFMWLLTLPLDKLILQGLFNLPMNLSGQLAIGNALFWTVVTPLIMWRVWGLPFLSSC